MKREERWRNEMIKATRFAARENYVDAVSRSKLIYEELCLALEDQNIDKNERTNLEALKKQAHLQYCTFTSQFEIWNEAIRKRRMARIMNAEEETKRPLPNIPIR